MPPPARLGNVGDERNDVREIRPLFFSPTFRNHSGKQLYDKAGKPKKVSRGAMATDGRVFREGSQAVPEAERHWISLRDVVVVALVMMLMLFALHCTWVTSNAYSR